MSMDEEQAAAAAASEAKHARADEREREALDYVTEPSSEPAPRKRQHAICGECRGVFRAPAWPDGARLVEATCPDCEAVVVLEPDDMGSTPVLDSVSPFARAGVEPTGGSHLAARRLP